MAASVVQYNVKDGKDSILEPLSLPESPGGSIPPDNSTSVPCILCEESYSLTEKDALLKHLILEHKLVIADVKLIADFRRYILYWRKRFPEQPIIDFCSVIRTNSEGPVEGQEDYFLLCDVLPEDRLLREQLQQKRLEEILEQQQRERNDASFHRVCTFCNDEFTGNRSLLLNHMAIEHGFNMGLPDNIVYCTEFLDTLQRKLDNLQCLYCEKTFRDKTTLKDHMRKKQHRRINAKNQEYDKFYVINYLELGKTWEEVQSEDDREMIEDQDDDWSDWQDHPVCAVCLFCEHQSETMDKIYSHMKDTHGFDLAKIKTELGLKFYQQVKLVNFMRREIHQCRCYGCKEKFPSKAEVLKHIMDAKHIMALQDKSTWDQPQYYFPTYENDALLCALSDSESESETDNQSKEIPVIAEDISNLKALKQTSVLNQLLKDRTYSS
ncbi:zinc finger protein 277 [Acipenser ruthenus]|uniref:zinc finger protein 277 n=1 Tax=Acipenser ruthenus TaxID=7906 RepID=UPI00145BBB33|nr:zinc finger protein 277 [Acipenser ruthenus]